jgi:hypothetical protein
LSANTNSCGGEGALSFLGRGGGDDLPVGLGAFEKNFNIPSFLVNCKSLSTSEGTEERDDSESEAILCKLWWYFGDDEVWFDVKRAEAPQA